MNNINIAGIMPVNNNNNHEDKKAKVKLPVKPEDKISAQVSKNTFNLLKNIKGPFKRVDY